MTHSYKILNAQVANDQVEATECLKVTVQVYLDGQELGEPKHYGFRLDAKEENIKAELDRIVTALDKELEPITDAEREAKEAAAQSTIEALLTKENLN
jgi:formylmethanofuran dehydrogenase subunit A